ncbi:MAG: HipA domain-containing protein [Verrucomicrobiota bacterium]|nr:HipA domain-containing protein [Verrucomicrobiota bacterium]
MSCVANTAEQRREMLAAAGADMPDRRLIETRIGRFFAVRRFDRPAPRQRPHLHSAAGLLPADS